MPGRWRHSSAKHSRNDAVDVDALTPATAQAVRLSLEPLFCGLPVPVLVTDRDNRIAFVNDEFTRVFGWTMPEVAARNLAVLHDRNDLRRLITVHGQLRRAELAVNEDQWSLRHRDGREVRARIRTRLVTDAGGQHLVGVVLSSHASPVEPSSFSQDDLFRALFDDAPIPITIQDENFRLIDVNAACENWLGYSRDELIGRDPLELSAPDAQLDTRQSRATEIAQSMGRGVAVRHMRHRNGRDLHARVHFRPIEGRGGARLFLSAIVDLSDDIELQRRLAQQVRRMEQFFELAPVGLIIRDQNHRIDRVNRAFTAMSGYSEDELKGRDATLVPPGNEAAHLAVHAAWQEARRGPDSLGRARVPLLTRDDRPVFTDRICTSIEDIDGNSVVLTVVTDITAEHKLEDELRSLVMQQGALLRTMTSGVMMVRNDRVVRSNASLERLLGRDSGGIVGREVGDVLHSEPSWERLREQAQRSGELPADDGMVIRVHRPAGEILCAMQIRPIDPDSPIGMIITLHDITEIKAQQDRLSRTDAELGALVDNTAVAVAYLEGERFSRCNRPMQALLGAAGDELIGRDLRDFAQPDDEAFELMLRGLSARPRLPRTAALRLRRLDGAEVACLMHLGPVDPRHAPDASIVVAIDMSGQQAALSALAATQERFGRFAEAVDEAVFVIDAARGEALFANRRFELVLGVGADDFLQNPASAWRYLTETDRARVDDLLHAALSHGHQEADVHVALPDGRLRVLRLRFFPARLGSAEIYCLAEDVTDIRDMAERRLQDAIRQKDTLVREVHHRIKNNLQGVAGLLQQSAARRPEIASQLDEIVGQIQAIAQVHGLQVRDKGALPLASLVLAVIEHLSRGFGVVIRNDLRRAGETQEWRVPEQEAVPIALVINELCTNAIKHRQGGDELQVELIRVDQSLMLVVRNPGELKAGFALERYEPSPSGLGLIKALLPRRGTRLALRTEFGQVVSELQMWPPVIRFGDG